MTCVNVFAALLVACAVFSILQIKTNDIREISERQRRAKLIQPGDIYEYHSEGNALEPGKTYRYTVVDAKDGYVSFRFTDHPSGSVSVERGTEFLKYKVKAE